ncbi:purine-nucleoside phosphorylase [Thalassobaculum salexigens]|uniref:purine-nucleoside phosphorylase n=1 Tax=Thalassobaculum salexigens TaxID=455360 RepID=UPI0004243D08|nr:purine-nucleoside phosphorylase [Thalassobaculum salexigens]
MTEIDRIDAAVAAIQAAAPGFRPRLGIVLGSGLDACAEAITDPVDISYADIPGFPKPAVDSHAGRLRLGSLGGVPVAMLRGRAHAYEGHPMADVVRPVRTLVRLGCNAVVLTNAAGSLREEVGPGRLMAIADHINWSGQNPLTGPNLDALGARFIDMTTAYDPGLRGHLAAAAEGIGLDLAEGVYFWYPGPSFETPAEIRAFRTLGADAVGMSTVPECIALRHMGVKVAGISTITNLAAGMGAGAALDHADVMTTGAGMAMDLARLLTAFAGIAADDL